MKTLQASAGLLCAPSGTKSTPVMSMRSGEGVREGGSTRRSIFRAFNKGALAILKADGPEDKTIYSGKEVDAIYIGDRAAPNLEAVSNAASAWRRSSCMACKAR